MADLFSLFFDPYVWLTGGGLFILCSFVVGMILYRDKMQMFFLKLFNKFPITVFVFELRANIPIPVQRVGAIKLPSSEARYDVLQLQTGEKVRVFGYSSLYTTPKGQNIMFLLRVGTYEFHAIEVILTEPVEIPVINEEGNIVLEKVKVQATNEYGEPILDKNGKPKLKEIERPKVRAVQHVLFQPRIDEDAMAWVVREMRRAEQRRRDKTLMGTVLPLLAPLLLCIGLMVLLNATLRPLETLATQLGPDIRALTAAIHNIQIIAAGPAPPI